MRARALARRAFELTCHRRAVASIAGARVPVDASAPSPSAAESSQTPSSRRPRVYTETYGCQMNASDSDVVRALLLDRGFDLADDLADAQAALVNTCAIRDGAESRIWTRLRQLKAVKRDPSGNLRAVGVLGCMAERLKGKLLETDGLADVVCGPDAYRDLPRLLGRFVGDDRAERATDVADDDRMNVQLSLDETYADVTPVRRDKGSVSAYVSVMRGCDNMCAFCVVPFTRGRERSRPMASVVDEARRLIAEGVREITLLGQNVNSYADKSEMTTGDDATKTRTEKTKNAGAAAEHHDAFAAYAKGFTSVYKPKREGANTFADLLAAVAAIDVECRVRFTSPHPKDFPDDVLRVVAETPNVCKQLHVPAQSGSSTTLERMRRGYTREAYDDLIAHIRTMIPDVALSSDFISGFCGETEDEHAATLDLLERVEYEQAFMFHYSRRDKTHAARHFEDDVPEETKKRRLAEVIDTFRRRAAVVNARERGRTHLVLIEGPSSKNPETRMRGRSDTGKRVIVRGTSVKKCAFGTSEEEVAMTPGMYVAARVTETGASSLVADPVGATTARVFYERHGGKAWFVDGE